MNHIFKITNNTPPVVPTVGDTNFPNHYTDVNRNMAWAEMEPTIRTAADEWLLPFVGEALYSSLATLYNTNAVLSDAQAKTLTYMQDALANYAIYKKMPEKIAVITSLGVVQNTPDGGSQTTSQWAYKEKRLAALSAADSALDRLLNHLENMVVTGVAYFDLYKNAGERQYKTCDFIKSAKDLDDYLNIQRSRRSFVSLITHLKQVERDVIRPTLCDTLYNALTGVTVSETNKKLLPYIREVVAYMGAAEALPHHRVAVDGDGFRVISKTDGFEDRRNLTNSVHEQAVGALLEKYKERGNRALRGLVSFLEANLADYPDYRDSNCRTKPTQRGHGMVASDNRLGSVGMF